MSTSILDVRRCVMIAGLLWGMTATPVSAATLYVAPDGNDAWSGKLEQPNAEQHRRAAGHAGRGQKRRAAAEGPRPLKEAVHVNVAAGTYPLARRWSSSRKTAARPRPRSSTRRPTERGPCLPAGGRSRLRPGRGRPVESPSARGPGRQVVFRGPVRQRSPRNPRPIAQRVLLLRSRQGRGDAAAGVCGRPQGHRAAGGAAQGTA